MKQRPKRSLDLLPDVSPLAVIGFAIIPFFIMSSNLRQLGDYNELHVRLPDACYHNTCSMIDGHITSVYLDKTQRLYVLVDDKNRNSHLIPMPSFQVFLQTIDSILTHSEHRTQERFVIRADKNTKMSIILRIMDCIQIKGIHNFILVVDGNSLKHKEYLEFLDS